MRYHGLAEFDMLAAQQPAAVGPPLMARLILEGQGNDGEARKRFECLTKKAPHAPVASNNLARMYPNRGEQLDRALQLARAAAQAAVANHPDFNVTLAFVYQTKQLPSLAIPPLRLAAKTGPGKPSMRSHLGLGHPQTGESAKARQSPDRALDLKPDFDRPDAAQKAARSLSPS
jgi:Tfp pilus assembly protein PilF